MGNKSHLGGDRIYCAPDICVMDVTVESGFALSLGSGGEDGNWSGGTWQ